MKFLKTSFHLFILMNIVFTNCSNPAKSTPQIEPLVLTIVPTNVSVYDGSDGSVNLEVSGGTIPYNFIWSNGDTTEDISNLTAGSYSVTVTDGNFQKKSASATVSPPGKILFTLMSSGAKNGIYMMNSDGSNLHRLINSGEDAIYGGSALSPVLSKIAFYSHPDSATTWSIYIMDLDGKNLIRLTNTQNVHDYSPTWSADGSKIAFQREISGNSEIWVMNSDGSNVHQIDSTIGSGPEWSLNGDKIVYYSDSNGNQEIYSMNADGTNSTRLTNNIYMDTWPAWSPDGSQITFTSERSEGTSIYVMNSDGTHTRQLTNGSFDTRPDWSPDGTRIAFVSVRDGNPEIYVMDADGRNETRLTYSSGSAIHPDWFH